jgi:hypothetical protein
VVTDLDFLDSEKLFFEPILRELSAVDEAQLFAYRCETVEERQRRVSRLVYHRLKGTIIAGPFTGMSIDPAPIWSELNLGSICLGLYEKHILDLFLGIKRGEHPYFICLGAADGYYPVGALFAGVCERAIAYEITSEGRQSVFRNWILNGSPGRLDIRGEATSEEILALADSVLQSAFILIDIEGAEFSLLTTQVLNKLRCSTIIIEIHHWVSGFMEKYESLLLNAMSFFEVSVVEQVSLSTTCFTQLRSLPDANRLLLVAEGRPSSMRFILLRPRH